MPCPNPTPLGLNDIILANIVALKQGKTQIAEGDPLDAFNLGVKEEANMDVFLNLQNIEDVDMSMDSSKRKRIEQGEEASFEDLLDLGVAELFVSLMFTYWYAVLIWYLNPNWLSILSATFLLWCKLPRHSFFAQVMWWMYCFIPAGLLLVVPSFWLVLGMHFGMGSIQCTWLMINVSSSIVLSDKAWNVDYKVHFSPFRMTFWHILNSERFGTCCKHVLGCVTRSRVAPIFGKQPCWGAPRRKLSFLMWFMVLSEFLRPNLCCFQIIVLVISKGFVCNG